MCCNSVVEPPHSGSLFAERISCFTLHKEGTGVYALHKPNSPSHQTWIREKRAKVSIAQIKASGA